VRGRDLAAAVTSELRSSPAAAGAPQRGDPLQAPAGVLLVADVRLYRELLAGALADEDGIELAGSASCDVAAMAAGMFQPDVVLVDTASVSVPDGLRALAAALPNASIVAVGVPDDEESVVALLEAGAAGYVTAEQPLADLVAAVEAAMQGELQLPPRMAAALARRMAALAAGENRDTNDDALTPRQREIAVLIADGLSNKQIARRLSIEHATVKNHVHSILVKLAVSRRDQVGPRLAAL
jgi:two-component system, NarL family, nitrate/nitrite response regulator NarL